MMFRLVSFVLSLFAIAPVFAQLLQPESDTTSSIEAAIENITITGQRPEGWSIQDYMLDFVGEIGDPASDSHGYARWRDKICVSVHNLRNAQTAQYVADRVSAVALEVGLRPEEPGCTPDLSIIFTSDGAALATSMVSTKRSAFRPYGGAGGTTQGLDALEKFATSDAPVRWWQVTMPVDRLGNIAVNVNRADQGIPVVWSSGFLITKSISDEVWATYVIVDITKIGNAGWEALADYVAMVSLAQVDPKGVPANYNSILNLFKTTNPAKGLTELDWTYLRALYAMDTRRTPRMQRSLLASTMVLEQDRAAEKTVEPE
ncbi:MAG: hypothetical protein V4628_15520 [Pseudomonadota bacterium]